MEKYQPSNGSEGEGFTEKFCMRCVHCNPDPCGKKQCEILLMTLTHDVKDDKYPAEWTYDTEGKPICTKWKEWDWDEKGDPDDPKNENYVMPEDPNQLKIEM